MTTKPGFPHTVIRASAGTGKTYQLSNRFIGLLASGARPDEILATTFTRKAAGEILDRVLLRLAEAANDEAKHKELAEAIGDKKLTRDRCRELLVSTVRCLHRLRVGTLDSYFLQVASSFALELGLPPGWSIGEELDDALLRGEAIELVLARGRLSDLLALVHSLTKGTSQRGVGQLVHDTVGGLFELFRETTPEAWQQLPRHKELPAEELDRIFAAIESFELPTTQLANTRSKDVEKARLGRWDEFLKSGIGAKIHGGETTFNRKPLPVELVGLYQLLLKQAEAVLVGQIARQTEATYDLLARFAEHYFALQHDERILRFSDVTQRLSLAGNVALPEQMAFRLDAGLQHVLLDEFQDTSPMQWRVLRPLAQAVAAAKGGSFFCVGDAKQAIYGWRGGVAAIFGALDGELPGLTHCGLDTSFRSSQPVIDTVNQVFQNLTKHPNLDRFSDAVADWQQQFPPHKTAKSDLPGFVTLTTAPEPTDDQDPTETLFDHAAERIAAAAKEAPAASIGVLVRTNKAVAHLIYLLRKRDILASEEGGNPLSDSPAVELILSLLKLADHPGDTVARFHLATSPLAAPLELSDYRDDRAAVRISQDLRQQLLDDGYGATIHAWVRTLAESCDRRDLSRLQQLVELAYDYQPRSTLRADQFVALVQSKRIADPAASRVRVMTIHQAKGLEFDIVFLPELGGRLYGQREEYVAGRPSPTEPFDLVCRSANENVRQFFPPKLAKLFDDDTKDEVTESLCVLYVAMTRAVHALHMILPPAKVNEKSLPKTYAGLLRAALAPGQPASGGRTLYEHGDPTWFAKLPLPLGEGRDEGGNVALDAPPPVIRLAKPLKTKSRNLQRTSPSALEGGSKLRASRLLEPRPDDAFSLGTLIHAWLAEIEWLDGGLPSDDRLRQIAAQLRPEIGPLADNLDLPLANVRRWLAAAPIAKVLSRSFYDAPKNLGLPALNPTAWNPGEIELEVLREHPFAIRDGDEILSGAIDRLVLIKRAGQLLAADILDFKTDELPPNDSAAVAARTDFYRPQMEAYCRAVGKLLQIESDRMGARIVYLNSSIVNPIA
jgi:ATP-dependent exoDNAse (exonuclease V) beta subunit